MRWRSASIGSGAGTNRNELGYDAGLTRPSRRLGMSAVRGYYASVNVVKAYFGSYREVFARDLYEAFTGLLVAGDVQTAREATLFLFDRQQQADGSMPRNSLENGMPAPDTGGCSSTRPPIRS